MDLTFVQTSNMFGRDGAWETEFSVDQEFNLHLERESSGKIIMMQKTAGTFFDIVKDFDMKSGDVVYDYDSASFLGTKTIKIVSESAIRFASLTTSGEVTEIKSQSKEVEVTANGTTEVTPDAGFAYLNSVKVKTNVATSGEGGGGGTELEGEYYLAKPNGRYWKTKFLEFERPNVPMFKVSEVSEEQVEMVMVYLMLMNSCGYSVIGYQGGMPTSAYDTTSFSPIETCLRCSSLIAEFSLNGNLGFIPAAFEECNSSLYHNGIIDLMRILDEGGFDGMTDDEVLAFTSEILMIELITKEEYDTWKYWNIN